MTIGPLKLVINAHHTTIQKPEKQPEQKYFKRQNVNSITPARKSVKCKNKYDLIHPLWDTVETDISKLVRTTRVWNNLHQVRSRSEAWKATYFKRF